MNGVRFILLALVSLTIFGLRAQTIYENSDTAEIKFHQSKWNLDRKLANNAEVIDSLDRKLIYIEGDSIYRIKRVEVAGAASPEGSEKFNKFLSKKRAETLFNHFSRYEKLRNAEHSFEYKGRDWKRVLKLVIEDQKVPYREEVISLLSSIISEKEILGYDPTNALNRIKRLRGGVPYIYLYNYIFPEVRYSELILDYEGRLSPKIAAANLEDFISLQIDSLIEEKIDVPVSLPNVTAIVEVKNDSAKPFYMDFRSNLLYDAVLLPNIGVDFYLGKGFSIGLNWMYGWWSKNIDHIYWRAYGGELNCRWWPKGRKNAAAGRSPFRGHHFGIYGQVYTYDFELRKKGEIGGKPHGTLFDQPFWAAGVEYGYSLPVANRFCIDFSLGVGYTTGIYYTYNPQQTHYVWQGTHRRKYFGPTKLEIALVWLIGHGNTNPKKHHTQSMQKGGDE